MRENEGKRCCKEKVGKEWKEVRKALGKKMMELRI